MIKQVGTRTDNFDLRKAIQSKITEIDEKLLECGSKINDFEA